MEQRETRERLTGRGQRQSRAGVGRVWAGSQETAKDRAAGRRGVRSDRRGQREGDRQRLSRARHNKKTKKPLQDPEQCRGP